MPPLYRLSTSLPFLSLLFAVSCTSKPDVQHAASHPFSLKKYFFTEARALSKQAGMLKKEVVLEGAKETRTIRVYSWEKELQLFSDADIDKPALLDKYRKGQGAWFLTYSAKDSSLSVKRLTITYRRSAEPTNAERSIEAITIQISQKNFLYRTSELLNYFPGAGYDMERTQTISLLGTRRVSIHARFVN